MSPPNREKDAFDLLADATKQVITLATGTVVLSATFLKDVLPRATNYRWLLLGAWVLLTAVVPLGLWLLYRMVGRISNGRRDPREPGIRGLALLQWALFVLGLVAFWLFVLLNV